MPLSEPVERVPAHTRRITGIGYRRADGLWDIEGRLVDTKHAPIPNTWRGEIPPGAPIHEMLVRLTLDNTMTVVAVECVTDSSPYEICGAIVPNYQRLIGHRIGVGWTRRAKALVGGADGCAHHGELIGLLATVAFQTMGGSLAAERGSEGLRQGRQFVINSCHMWRADGEMAAQFGIGADQVSAGD